MKVIFLDFDGVLNTPANWGKRPLIPNAITPELVRRVSDLVVETDAHVVISSTWRHFETLDALRDALHAAGFVYPNMIIGVTPRLNLRRDQEIRRWLDDNNVQHAVIDYVVLDDDSAGDGNFAEVEGHWVHVDYDVGLSVADCLDAKCILGVA